MTGFVSVLQVAHLTKTTASDASTYGLTDTIKATGLTFPSSISADYAGNIWLTATAVADNSGGTSVFKITASVDPATADPVSLTFPNSDVGAPPARLYSYCVGSRFSSAEPATCRGRPQNADRTWLCRQSAGRFTASALLQPSLPHKPGCLHQEGCNTQPRCFLQPCVADHYHWACCCCRRQRRPHRFEHGAAPGFGLLVLDPQHGHRRCAHVRPARQLRSCPHACARVPNAKPLKQEPRLAKLSQLPVSDMSGCILHFAMLSHDNCAGYAKWNTGSPAAMIAFTALSANSHSAGLTVDVSTSDDCLFTGTGAAVHGPSSFTAPSSSLYSSPIGLGAGQCIKVRCCMHRPISCLGIAL